jgi:hypothetical protein
MSTETTDDDDMPFPDPNDDEAIAKFLDARFERNVRRLLDRNRQLEREDAEIRERLERCEREIASLAPAPPRHCAVDVAISSRRGRAATRA